MNDNSGFGAIRSMDYVIVLCDDLDRMQRFYTDIFGFRPFCRPSALGICDTGTLA